MDSNGFYSQWILFSGNSGFIFCSVIHFFIHFFIHLFKCQMRMVTVTMNNRFKIFEKRGCNSKYWFGSCKKKTVFCEVVACLSFVACRLSFVVCHMLMLRRSTASLSGIWREWIRRRWRWRMMSSTARQSAPVGSSRCQLNSSEKRLEWTTGMNDWSDNGVYCDFHCVLYDWQRRAGTVINRRRFSVRPLFMSSAFMSSARVGFWRS